MLNKGSFCDGKRYVLVLSIFCGVFFYYVDWFFFVRFYVLCLVVLFFSVDKIVLGRGFKGCVFCWIVNNCFNKIKEYCIVFFGECVVKSE